MPGIVGIVTRVPREQAELQLIRMVGTLRHESFYKVGTWIDEGLGAYVGWSCREQSFDDGMPLQNERRDRVLIFAGEDYPDPGTASRLEARGHVMESARSSYLVHLSEEDVAFPVSLNGRFHGVLIDRAQDSVMLFNDRYGIHRVYYHESPETFYFAAEAKAILAVRPELRTADPRSMGEFVACGCVLENRSLFKGIYVLPTASAWMFRHARIEQKRTYFQPREWESQTALDQESYYQEIRGVFSQNLPRYFDGNERVAMSLTGGLDTRMIMAWRKAPAGSLPCYSFGGMFRDSQDVLVARQVARACGQSHEIIRIGRDFLARFPRYAERTIYLTDGCLDVSHSPDLYANEKAATIAPVRMTGNYGGEMFRRVRAFKPVAPAQDLFHPALQPFFHDAAETYESLLQEHPLSFAAFRQTPWHHYGLLALEQTQLALRSPFLDNDLIRTLFRAPASVLESNDVSLRLIADGDLGLRQIRTDRGLAGRDERLPAAIARRLLEFSFKAEYAYDYGMPQSLARIDHALSPLHLERFFLGRHKFYHFRIWYRDALAEYVRSMLLDSLTLSRPYLQRKMVAAITEGHLNGTRNYTLEIHKILTLELIHRLFLDSRVGETSALAGPVTAAMASERRSL